jgi:hypothetical protein
MEKTDVQHPVLSEEEWALVARLLASKQRELLGEIRHTDRRAFREELQRQLGTVQSLLDRIPAYEEKE